MTRKLERQHVISAYDALSGVDVVHDNTLAGPLYALEVPGVPVVTTHHGPFDDAAGQLFAMTAGRVAGSSRSLGIRRRRHTRFTSLP